MDIHYEERLLNHGSPIGKNDLAFFAEHGLVLCQCAEALNVNAEGPKQLYRFRNIEGRVEYHIEEMPAFTYLGVGRMNDLGRNGWVYACSGPSENKTPTKIVNHYFYRVVP